MVSIMRIGRNKKGISPLIAAVLLIVFTVAIGAVVLNWMTQYTKGTTERAGTDTSSTVECAKQILDIMDVRYNSSAGKVDIYLQNLGSASSTITTAVIYDDNGNQCSNDSLNIVVPPGGFKAFTPLTSCTTVSDSSYTVRVASSCGASDVYTYPQQQ